MVGLIWIPRQLFMSWGPAGQKKYTQAVAWPPRRSAGRRESGSQRPWLGEAAPQPEGSSVCAQQAPARLGFPGAFPQRQREEMRNKVRRVVFYCVPVWTTWTHQMHISPFLFPYIIFSKYKTFLSDNIWDWPDLSKCFLSHYCQQFVGKKCQTRLCGIYNFKRNNKF